MSLIEEFEQVIALSNTLVGEKGCLWKKKQTFDTLKRYLLEETYEVLEAVEEEDSSNLLEELGDLLYLIIFFSKIAEKEGRFTLEEVLASIRKKLIGRHPHVFGDEKWHTLEEIQSQWATIKQKEKSHRKSKMEGLPKMLPALAKAEKMVELLAEQEPEGEIDEESLGKQLYELVALAYKKGLHAEFALNREIAKREEFFRKKASS